MTRTERIESDGCVIAALPSDQWLLSDRSRSEVVIPRGLIERALSELTRPVVPADHRIERRPGGRWNPITVADLVDGTPCRWRHGVADGTGTTWSAWESGVLVVSRRAYDVPRSHRDQTQFWRSGDPESVGIAGKPEVGEFAPDDLSDGLLSVPAGDVTVVLEVLVPG